VLVRSWPRLVAALGDTFHAKFEAFSKEFPPDPRGPSATASPSPAGSTLVVNSRSPPAPSSSPPGCGAGRPSVSSSAATDQGVRLGIRLPWLGVRMLRLPFFSR
jgi:hypothetical protein